VAAGVVIVGRQTQLQEKVGVVVEEPHSATITTAKEKIISEVIVELVVILQRLPEKVINEAIMEVVQGTTTNLLIR